MKHIIEIEKYKVSLDEEGNEIFTQVDAVEGQRTLKKANYLNFRFGVSLTSSNMMQAEITSRGYIFGFKQYALGISNLKVITKATENESFVTTSEEHFKRGFMLGETPSDASITSETGSDIRTVAFKTRFSPPNSEAREINCLRVFNTYSSPVKPMNHIYLDVPCIQNTDEILIINYRYQYSYKRIKDSMPFSEALEAVDSYSLDGAVKSVGYNHSTDMNLTPPPNRIYMGTSTFKKENGTFAVPLYGATTDTISTTTNSHPVTGRSYESYREGFRFWYSDLPISRLNGRYMHSLMLYPANTFQLVTSSSNRLPVGELKLRNPLESALQNGYMKKFTPENTVRLPFYDIDYVGDSLGSVNMSESFQSGDSSYESIPNLAQVIRTEITNGGATGNSSYRVSTRYLTGFLDVNDWRPEASSPVLLGKRFKDENEIYLGTFKEPKGMIPMTSWAALGRFILPLELGEVLVYMPWNLEHEDYGLWVYTLDMKVEPLHIAPTTLAGYGATDIRGVTTAEDGTIFVACANTGLWKLKRNKGDSLGAMQVTRVTNTGVADDSKCYAVNFIRLNHRFNSDARIAAVFGDDLAISDDGGNNWSVYNTTSNPKFEPIREYTKLLGINGHPTKNIIALTYMSNNQDVEFLDYSKTRYDSNATPNRKTDFWYIDESTDVSSVFYTNNHYCYTSGQPTSVFSFKGGSNFAVQPLLHPDYSFVTGYRSSYLDPIALEPTTNVRAVLQYLNTSTDYATQSPMLVDDIANSTTYILCPTSRNVSGTTGSVWFKDIAAILNNDNAYATVACKNSYLAPVPVGRGLFLSYGTAADNNFKASFSGSTSYLQLDYMCFSLFHVGLDSDDYYKDNRMNFWFEYSYNVSSGNWELLKNGTPTSKVTHTTVEPIIAGLSNSFTDSSEAVGNAGNFIASEIHDQYVCDGVLKDDYTTVKFNFFTHYGNSTEGNTFTPSTVPANPIGSTTEKLTVQYAKWWENSGNGRNDTYLPIYFDPEYVGVINNLSSSVLGTINDVGNVTLGENITGDFEIETQLSYSGTGNLSAYVNSSYLYQDGAARPNFVLQDVTTISGLSVGDIVYGVGITRTEIETDLNDLKLVIQEGSTRKYYDLYSYDPKEVFRIVRTGNEIKLYREGVLVDTSTVTPTTLRAGYRIVRHDATGEVRNNYYYPLLVTLFKPKITYNNQSLKVKIGDPTTKTGAYSPNFQHLSVVEWENGIKKLYLDGVEANIIYDRETNEPPAGTIRINVGSGELYFNSADAGKVITGDWRIVNSINYNGE